MSKGLAKLEKAVELEGKALVDLSKKSYQMMARGWWEFAKAITLTDARKAWEVVGFKTFKDFCEENYPSVAYVTLVKYTHIVDEFYEIFEAKLKKDDKYKLPAYEACYMLTASKDKIEEEEFSKMKKELVEEKVSVATFTDRIKALKTKHSPTPKAKAEDLEEELSKDIEEELDEEVEETEIDAAGGEEIDAEDIDKSESTLESLLQSIPIKLEALTEDLTQVIAEVSKKNLDNTDIQVMAEKLDEFCSKADKFFTKLEKLEG